MAYAKHDSSQCETSIRSTQPEHPMNLADYKYYGLLDSDESKSGKFEPPLSNIGGGYGLSIQELAEPVKEILGYPSKIRHD